MEQIVYPQWWPTRNIPKQLCQPQFKFYKALAKLPAQQGWNKAESTFNFFDQELKNWNANYGVVCGVGGPIILDFDNQAYYDSIKSKLPTTFTVLSATKRLPHLYYKLDGAMFNKIPINDDQSNRLCDIQAIGSGIIGPGSIINRRYYEVSQNLPIATITIPQLENIFGIKISEPLPKKEFLNSPDSPLEVRKAHSLLQNVLGLKLTKFDLYNCPLHPSVGSANLHVTPWASIHCFHENRGWKNALSFAMEYSILKRPELVTVLRIIEQETK